LPEVQYTDKALAQAKRLPRSVRLAIIELDGHLARSPMRLPPWFDVKLMTEGKGLKVFRWACGRYRGVFSFDGGTVLWVTFRDRPNVRYQQLIQDALDR
jgi:mRNA-degrading endonuclease RelE of RelBE toxin-antitoxin system